MAVHKKNLKRRIHDASSLTKLVKSKTLSGLQAEQGSEFKTKFAKYPNKERTSTALGSLLLVSRGHVTKRARTVDRAYCLNNFRRNPFDQNTPKGFFFYRRVRVCNRKVIKYRNSPGDERIRSQSKLEPVSSQATLRMRP